MAHLRRTHFEEVVLGTEGPGGRRQKTPILFGYDPISWFSAVYHQDLLDRALPLQSVCVEWAILTRIEGVVLGPEGPSGRRPKRTISDHTQIVLGFSLSNQKNLLDRVRV